MRAHLVTHDGTLCDSRAEFPFVTGALSLVTCTRCHKRLELIKPHADDAALARRWDREGAAAAAELGASEVWEHIQQLDGPTGDMIRNITTSVFAYLLEQKEARARGEVA